jgi:uncharacterized protein
MTDSVAALLTSTTLLIAAMTFLAAFVRGLTGFGMAIILVPLFGMAMVPERAVVLAILLQLLIAPAGIQAILASADRRSALMIGGIAMLATPVGLFALGQTPPPLARVLIAGIAIAAFLAVIWPPRSAPAKPGTRAAVVTGVASGPLTGFAAMPGPPVIPFYLRQAIAPAVARASMMLVFAATSIAGAGAAAAMSRIGWHEVILAFILFIPMWLGNHLGGMAFGRVSPPLWRSGVALLLGIAAASAVIRML